jgi:transmembrane sensor
LTNPDVSGGRDAEQEASRWAVRISGRSLSGDERAALDAWLAEDPRRHGVLLRARAGLKLIDRTLAAEQPHSGFTNDNDTDTFADGTHPKRWRVRVFAGGFAVAVGLAAIVAIGRPVIVRDVPTSRQVTENMQTLGDGSIVTLTKNARIEADMSADARRIVLIQGKATFAVARDPQRPFVVQSGAVFAQATGTVYSVERIGLQGGAVDVAEGSVLVWARDEREQAVLLHAGDKLKLAPTVNAARTAPPLPEPDIAKISLDNVTIAAAAARFNKINRRQIVIENPEIGSVQIVGLFKASEPERFAEAAAAVADASIIYEKDHIVIK